MLNKQRVVTQISELSAPTLSVQLQFVMLIIKWDIRRLYGEEVSFNYGIKKGKRWYVSGSLKAPAYWRIAQNM
jgi:hypothetical protein